MGDYDVKDKLFMEWMLGSVPQVFEQSIFFNDFGHSFDAILFFGNEFTLFAFNVLVFSIVDFSTGNTVLAVVVTWLVYSILSKMRCAGGKKNLAQKTMVDERFLI